jgi:ribosomal protein S18 acetylase RimI-like enzyme
VRKIKIKLLTAPLALREGGRILELINCLTVIGIKAWEWSKLKELEKLRVYKYSYVAVDENKNIVGLLLAYLKDNELIYIRRLCVDSSCRRKGVGRKLLEKLLNSLPKKYSVEDETGDYNVASCKLYEEMNFIIVGGEKLKSKEFLYTYFHSGKNNP